MNKILIKDRTKQFALKIIILYKYLIKQKEYIISKQILRSGTSIGANISESIGAESRKDFLHKVSIAYKEAQETKYWLDLLTESEYIIKTKTFLPSYNKEIIIILKILNVIIHKIKKTNT